MRVRNKPFVLIGSPSQKSASISPQRTHLNTKEKTT